MGESGTIDALGEFGLIARYFAPLAGAPDDRVALGQGDDAAVFTIPRTQQLVVTTDTLAEGTHFLGTTAADLVGRKALLVNLSDLAAMGAEPAWMLLNLSLPEGTPLAWLAGFAAGLREEAERHGVRLVGGDTVRGQGGVQVTVTLMGLVGLDRALRRSGAQSGDLIVVSGTLGDAALGLALRQGRTGGVGAAAAAWLEQRLDLPQPRLALGRGLLEGVVGRGVIDLSDGLLSDLGHVCRASGLAARVRLEDIPLSAPAREWMVRQANPWPLLLGGGEDYELLFCVPPAGLSQVQDLGLAQGVAVTVIGEMVSGTPGVVASHNGQELDLSAAGWKHFPAPAAS
ncbi:MAG: thiamine-phosphate kinase [Magnetococcus sp. WYHC-3]